MLEHLGLHRNNYSEWKAGRNKSFLLYIDDIARYFDVSPTYLHGYEVQIEEYGKAEQTDKQIYVLIDLGHPVKVKKVPELHDKMYNAGENPPKLIIIDSTEIQSASRT